MVSSSRTFALAVAAFASLGCAAFKPPLTGPAGGGARWIELRSPHFVVDTDADLDEARKALADFEGIEALLSTVAFPRATGAAASTSPQPTQVVIFARKEEYAIFTPLPLATAYFNSHPSQEIEGRPRAVLNGVLDARARVIFQHELAHRHIHESLARPPVWLNEGLAEYFSTAHVDGGHAFIGEPPRHFIRRDTGHGVAGTSFSLIAGLPSAASVISLDAEHFYAGHDDNEAGAAQRGHYAASWVLVHLMMNGPEPWRTRFGRYLDALHGGAPNDVAWSGAFDDVPPEELEHAFRQYAARPYVTRAEVDYPPPPAPPPPTVRALSDAEVHVLWAKLLPFDGGAGAERELARAAATAPDDAEVRLTRGVLRLRQRRFAEALVELEAGRARAPNDSRILTALIETRLAAASSSTPVDQSALATLGDRLETVAATSAAFEALARARLYLNQTRAGFGAAKRAVEADPSCYRCLDTLATILDRLGEREKAVDFEARAIDLAPETSSHEAMRHRLEKYRAAAAKPSPP